MQWHDYPLAWKAYSDAMDLRGTPLEHVQQVGSVLYGRPGFNNTINQLLGEIRWSDKRRPYYDLYPGVAKAFTKVDLDKIMCHHLHLPLPELLIRLPVGHEIQGGKKQIRSILAMETPVAKYERGWLLSIHDGETIEVHNRHLCAHHVIGISLRPDTPIAVPVADGRKNPYIDDELDSDEADMAVRIVAAICLLKDDADLIEPLPLADDVAKWEATHDPALLDKAARRGKRAWAVGKGIELTPHFRRPHFAIRWCGPGGHDPRLRPIKGSIVLRDKAKQVPTGYLETVTQETYV